MSSGKNPSQLVIPPVMALGSSMRRSSVGARTNTNKKEQEMSVYTEYADRLSERYGVLRRIDLTPVSWEEGYIPFSARRGPDHVKRELDRFHDTLSGARKRVREEQIKQLLEIQPEWDLLWHTLLGGPMSIGEVVQRESRVVLLGAAGAGKTTALRSLAVDRPKALRPMAGGQDGEGDRLLTVLVDLSGVPNLGDASLPEVLSADAQQSLEVSASSEFFQDVLVRGQAVIGIDGLDEIAGQAERAKAIRQIEAWIDEFPSCRYVVAVRPNAYEPLLSGDVFVNYALTPWSETVVADLERAWNEALDAWTVEEPDRFFYAERRRLWQHLALAMRLGNRQSASLEEAGEWLAEAVRNDKKLRLGRRKIPAEVGALLEQGPSQLAFVVADDGQLSFTPRLLHDVLAARALESLCVDKGVEAAWEEIQGRVQSLSWRQCLELALHFLVEDHPDLAGQLLDRLLEVDVNDPWEPILHRRLLIAASSLAGVPDTSGPDAPGQDAAQRVVDAALAWMTDAKAVGRADAVDALSGLITAAPAAAYAVDKVLQIVSNGDLDEWSREAAALLLGRLGPDRAAEAVEVLEAHLDDVEEGSRVRLAAATALGALGSSGALDDGTLAPLVEGLIERVRDVDFDIDYRVATAESLGQILVQTPNAAITETLVALAQGENGDERVPFSVQIAAARGLERTLAAKGDAQFAEQMWDLARDGEVDDSVRCVLAEMLGRLGGAEQAAQVLIALAQDDKVYPPGHRDALDALGRVGYADQAILDTVLQIAGTKDRKVKDFERLAASYALAGLGHLDLSLQHLLMLIADKSIYRSTRNDALGYLGQLGSTGDADLDAAAIAVLQVWVNEENTTEDVRENAMQSLCWMKASQDEVIRDLVGVVQNRTTFPRVRRVAAATLGRLGEEQKEMIVEALGPTFYDSEEKSDLLRVPIARLLFLWGGDEQALVYLRAAAEQSYMAQVRYNASMVLLEIGETELATAELIKLAQNPDISDVIRHDALRALGLWMVGDKEVAEAAATVAQDTSLESNVRGAAYASLSSITAT